MGAIAPRPKSCGAMPLRRPQRNFVMSPLYTVKGYSKITNVSLWKWKVHWFQPENAPKALDGQALPGPAGGAYSAPPGSLTEFKG